MQQVCTAFAHMNSTLRGQLQDMRRRKRRVRLDWGTVCTICERPLQQDDHTADDYAHIVNNKPSCKHCRGEIQNDVRKQKAIKLVEMLQKVEERLRSTTDSKLAEKLDFERYVLRRRLKSNLMEQNNRCQKCGTRLSKNPDRPNSAHLIRGRLSCPGCAGIRPRVINTDDRFELTDKGRAMLATRNH